MSASCILPRATPINLAHNKQLAGYIILEEEEGASSPVAKDAEEEEEEEEEEDEDEDEVEVEEEEEEV